MDKESNVGSRKSEVRSQKSDVELDFSAYNIITKKRSE